MERRRTYWASLNAARDNAVLIPTFYAGHHTDCELMFAPGRAIDAPSIPGNHYGMHFPRRRPGHKRYFRMLRMSFRNG